MIKVYTHPICPRCLILKQKLEKEGIIFEEINISGNEEIKNELIERTGGKNLPVVFIEGVYLSNPNIEDLIK